MTSTDVKIGMTSSTRPSSRVLQPPGGGHSNIFAEPEVSVNAPRPKYNQQNSSNLNACMGSTDPNHKVEQLRSEIKNSDEVKSSDGATTPKEPVAKSASSSDAQTNGVAQSRGRVPPGGYSSGGFW